MNDDDYGWKPYVSTAERRAKAEKAAAKAKKGGAIAKTFWGKAWCENLANYSDYASRLPRGGRYVRNGSVIDLQITPGEVRAKVMGSSLFTVSASVTAVPDTQWKTICDDCSGSIDSLVELLQGKLSNALMERICKLGTGLFPSPKEIKIDRSCPDWASMCKHGAAVLYGIGAQLDGQPKLLFGLRRFEVKDLVNQAGADLTNSDKRLTPGRALDDALTADLFGLEMAEALPAAKWAGRSILAAVEVAAKNAAGKKAATGKAPAKPSAVTPSAPESAPRKIQKPQSAPI